MKHKKHFSKILVTVSIIALVFTFAHVITTIRNVPEQPLPRTGVPHFPPDPERPLSLLELITQPPASGLCVPASIAMVENFFFGESNTLEDIFDHVYNPSRTGSATHRIPNYMESIGLHANMIMFRNLRAMLLYLEKNQIPAIFSLSTHIGANSLAGHAVVFTGYDAENDIISILDPADPLRTSIRFNCLEKYFVRIVYDSVTFGNVMIIATNQINTEIETFCRECNHRVTLDLDIIPATYFVRCSNCGHPINTFTARWNRPQ